jgi:hypothetical protein
MFEIGQIFNFLKNSGKCTRLRISQEKLIKFFKFKSITY